MSEPAGRQTEPQSTLRLAICGNVFPGDQLHQVTAALEGPWRRFQESTAESATAATFGLYLGQEAAADYVQKAPQCRALAAAMQQHGQGIWTGNAFPIGGFHGKEVKRKAFRPSWDQPQRLAYTLDAAEALWQLAGLDGEPPQRLSLSTCPLGYGEDPLDESKAIEQLRAFAAWALAKEQDSGCLITLALEPEPDGRFERVEVLAQWLASAFSREERRYLGICWDVCHAEVVGEPAADLLRACRRLEVTIAKVQVSAALAVADASLPAAQERLAVLAADPYLHQVRGEDAHGQAVAYPDLGPALQDAAARGGRWRVHCHVPVHLGDLGDGLCGTPWRSALTQAVEAGLRDFELETYTLPVLPASMTSGGLATTMLAEWKAVQVALGLTGP